MRVKITVQRRWRIRITRKWNFDYKIAIIWWVSLFIGFGPFYWLVFKNPFYYSMFQGLFVSTFTLSVMTLVDFFVKRRSAKAL